MAVRYSADFLVHLRDSPLCTKPPGLPPAEEWMGPPPEPASAARAQPSKTNPERRQDGMGSFDGTNRRPGVERHVSRNSANPEDIILGPPRTSFASSGGFRNNNGRTADQDKDAKDGETRDRFNFRGRNGDAEGWSTVKPRKSFGHEGAERFQGRMGGERFTNDRRTRERDDRDGTRDRPQRGFEREGEEGEGRPRNGLNRGKSEPWFKNEPEAAKPSLSNRERIDRAKSWRDRDSKDGDTLDNNDRNSGRGYDRRWDRDQRDQRNEREPEWVMEEPAPRAGGHTEEDFKKFMESMKAGKAPAATAAAPSSKQPVALSQLESSIKAEQPAVASAPAAESGPDKFFMAFAGNAGLNVNSPGVEVDKEPTPKPTRPGGAKPSRFTSFFSPSPQEEHPEQNLKQIHTEPPTPLAALMGGAGHSGPPNAQAPEIEKQAFQVLLQKLQRSNVQGSTPPAAPPFQQQQQGPPHELSPAGPVRSPSGYTQFSPPEQRHDPRAQQAQDIHAPRPVMPHQPISHQDKLLQDLVERQRQQASSQGSGRTEANRNTEFLMNLMKAQPEPIRTEQMLARMHQQRNPSLSHFQDREPDFPPQGGRGSQPPMRNQPPPGFMEEQFHRGEPDGRQQPTQILQRPPPPGLDQMGGWMSQSGPMPPQQRNMGLPPGLAGGPAGPGGPGGPTGPTGPGGPGGPPRNHPGIPGMFPPGPGPGPNFPPGAAFPPENMSGPPPRGMQPPPGFYGGPPPPGFMGPPGMAGPGFGGPGPDGPGFPFDGRGMPPPGAAQAFRRQ